MFHFRGSLHYIEQHRGTAPTAWEYVEELVDTVSEIEASRRNCNVAALRPNDTELRKFLEGEIGPDD